MQYEKLHLPSYSNQTPGCVLNFHASTQSQGDVALLLKVKCSRKNHENHLQRVERYNLITSSRGSNEPSTSDLGTVAILRRAFVASLPALAENAAPGLYTCDNSEAIVVNGLIRRVRKYVYLYALPVTLMCPLYATSASAQENSFRRCEIAKT